MGPDVNWHPLRLITASLISDQRLWALPIQYKEKEIRHARQNQRRGCFDTFYCGDLSELAESCMIGAEGKTPLSSRSQPGLRQQRLWFQSVMDPEGLAARQWGWQHPEENKARDAGLTWLEVPSPFGLRKPLAPGEVKGCHFLSVQRPGQTAPAGPRWPPRG